MNIRFNGGDAWLALSTPPGFITQNNTNQVPWWSLIYRQSQEIIDDLMNSKQNLQNVIYRKKEVINNINLRYNQ